MLSINKQDVKLLVGSIVLFIFIFPFKLNILPVNNIYILFAISFIYLIAKTYSKKSFMFRFHRTYVVFYFLIILLATWSLVSIYFSGNDFVVIKLLAIFSIGFVLISFFLTDLFFKDLRLESFLKIFVYVLFAQATIALVIFFSKNVKNFYLSVIDMQGDIEKISLLSPFRLIGLGINFFGMGLILSFGLIIIAWLVSNAVLSKKERNLFVLMYSVLLVTSLFSARTAFFGILLSFAYLLTSLNGFYFLIRNIIALILSSIILYILVPKDILDYLNNNVFPWAFEIIYKYSESNEIETESSNQLKNMYFQIANISTWIVGDGYMDDLKGNGYYMHTDAGYMRQVYSYGLVGLLISFAIYGFIHVNLVKMDNTFKAISLISIIFILILNIKGLMFFYSPLDKFIILTFVYLSCRKINKIQT